MIAADGTLENRPSACTYAAMNVEITSVELDEELAKAPMDVVEQLEKNKLFVLDNLATRELLLQSAREAQQGDSAALEAFAFDPACYLRPTSGWKGHIELVERRA